MAGVTLADMQPGGRTAGETGSAILARLVTGQGGEGREVQRKNLLWQARIVLKLAEQYDEEQRALSRAINAIEQRERELFSGLAADADENPFSLTGRLSSSSGDWDRMQRLRRKAWSRLLAFGEAPLPGGVFITTDGEALELLLDTQERETGLRPQVGATFLLPAAGEKGVEKLFEGADQLRGEVSTGNDGMPAPSGSWEQRLDEFFPTPRFGRCRLDLYPFPGARARHLFLETFGREKGFDMEIADEAPRDLTIGLLGGV
ncbi:MAG: hypothetical protein Kow0089_10250 [Desulfobulbaceae bacterium]